MLFATFARLEVPVSDLPTRNALVESLCVHARNLIEFLESTGSGVKARAATYDYKAFANGRIARALVSKINDQIAHLGFGRTCDPNDLIRRPGRLELLRAIAAELIERQKHVRPQYGARWKIEVTDQGASYDPPPCAKAVAPS
jgi:hypothetical protein